MARFITVVLLILNIVFMAYNISRGYAGHAAISGGAVTALVLVIVGDLDRRDK